MGNVVGSNIFNLGFAIAAAVIFAQEIQHALEQMLHEGRLAPVTSGRSHEENEKTDT